MPGSVYPVTAICLLQHKCEEVNIVGLCIKLLYELFSNL